MEAVVTNLEGPQFNPPIQISFDDGETWVRTSGAEHHRADSSPLKKLPSRDTVLRVVCTQGGRRRLFAVVTRPKVEGVPGGQDFVLFGVPPYRLDDGAPSEPRVVFFGVPSGVRHPLCACGRLHPVDLDVLWQHADRLRYSSYMARVINVTECRPHD